MPTYTFVCAHCGIHVTAKRGTKQKPPQYCSRTCFYTHRNGDIFYSPPKRTIANIELQKPIPQNHKRCRICGQVKVLDEFVKSKQAKDGHDTKCKECQRNETNSRRRVPEIARRYRESAKKRRRSKGSTVLGPRRDGYVYLFKWMNFYKIGTSVNVQSRLGPLSASLPMPGEILHTIPTNHMSDAELSLHDKFAAKRLNGEWFALSDEDIAWLLQIRSICSENDTLDIQIA